MRDNEREGERKRVRIRKKSTRQSKKRTLENKNKKIYHVRPARASSKGAMHKQWHE